MESGLKKYYTYFHHGSYKPKIYIWVCLHPDMTSYSSFNNFFGMATWLLLIYFPGRACSHPYHYYNLSMPQHTLGPLLLFTFNYHTLASLEKFLWLSIRNNNLWLYDHFLKAPSVTPDISCSGFVHPLLPLCKLILPFYKLHPVDIYFIPTVTHFAIKNSWRFVLSL